MNSMKHWAASLRLDGRDREKNRGNTSFGVPNKETRALEVWETSIRREVGPTKVNQSKQPHIDTRQALYGTS